MIRGEDSEANITLLLGPTWKIDGGLRSHFICRLLVLMDPEEGSVPFRAARAFYDAGEPIWGGLLTEEEEEEEGRRVNAVPFWRNIKEGEIVDAAPRLGIVEEEEKEEEESADTMPGLRLLKGKGRMTDTTAAAREKETWSPRGATEPEGVFLRRIKWETSENGFTAAPAPMVDFKQGLSHLHEWSLGMDRVTRDFFRGMGMAK